jgi:hypothetical protein
MKKSVFMMMTFLLLIQIDGLSQKKGEQNKVKGDTISVDSLEYRLIVSDPGFETWLATQKPENYYSKNYYEQKNRLYVTEWNYRYMTISNNGFYESYINYSPSIDYGLDLNYKLYYYFRYFEEKNHVRLLSSGR